MKASLSSHLFYLEISIWANRLQLIERVEELKNMLLIEMGREMIPSIILLGPGIIHFSVVVSFCVAETTPTSFYQFLIIEAPRIELPLFV